MGKVSRVHSMLLITALIITVLSPKPMQAAIRQQPHQLLTNINSKYLALSWGDIWNIFRRKKFGGGGRGGICAIAPRRLVDPNSRNLVTQEIWSSRPLFLWYIQGGTAQAIELFQNGSDEVLWSRKITPGQTKVIYDGKPLQPGQFYVWQLSAIASFPRQASFQFQVMEAQKRSRITNDLTKLEERLKKQGASAEKIALEKANYFAQQELWSDALREIYAVPNRSAELNSIIQQIPSPVYCDTAEAANAALSRVGYEEHFYISSQS